MCTLSLDDTEPAGCSELLRGLTLAEFRAGLRSAQASRDESIETFNEYNEWFARLEPYFARDASLTVDTALTLYRADRLSGHITGPRTD